MLIKSLNLINFRNHLKLNLNFLNNLNIIIGDNGIGKTNILESIYLTSCCKSFKLDKFQTLINFNNEVSTIESDVDNNKYKIVLNQKEKNFFINSNQIFKQIDFIGKVSTILFRPFDLTLLTTNPQNRRKYVDLEISKVNPIYLKNLLIYNKLIKDKNIILKQDVINYKLLEVINQKLIDLNIEIIKIRNKFFDSINLNINSIFQTISNSNYVISINYKQFEKIEKVKDKIISSLDNDIKLKVSTCGIHLEDFEFKFNNLDAKYIASQGQIRMIIIAFKLAIAKYIKEEINDDPIILLDDITSELDDNNQNRLLNYLNNKYQIILTTTNINKIKDLNYNLINLNTIKGE